MYPLIVIIGIFIYSIIDTTNNKGKHILYSSILTLPALIIIILNTVSMFSENVSSVITILNYVFVSIIAVIIIIYIVQFTNRIHIYNRINIFSFFSNIQR